MPKSDYNKVKKISPTSQNNSGATISKAQPVIIKGETTSPAVTDGFEDGDFTSSPAWTQVSGTGATVQTTTVKNGSNALELSGTPNTLEYNTAATVGNDDVWSCWMQANDVTAVSAQYALTNTSGDTTGNDAVRVFFNTGDIRVETYDGTGSVITGGSVATGVSTNTWYRVEVRFDTTNSEVTVEAFDSTGTSIGTLTQSYSGATSYSYVDVESENGDVGVTSYFDDVTYTQQSTVTDQKTGTGDIVLDFTNIADAQDIAMYDQNGNLLDYEIEDLDTTAETGVLWCYNSWVRDDTVQAQVAYGSNSANTDRQNVTGTWGNTGQNAVMVQHLNGNALDSTANNNDGLINGATSTGNGEFDGAYSFDGTDDNINLGTAWSPSQFRTISIWVKKDSTTSTKKIFNFEGYRFAIGYEVTGSNGFEARLYDGTNSFTITSGNTSTGEWLLLTLTYDPSTDTAEFFVDDVSQGTVSLTQIGDISQNARIGSNGDAINNFFDGDADEAKTWSKPIDQSFVQAEYDASPKAGQVFFSQQAAETTTTTQTISAPVSTVTSSTPNPSVTATGAATVSAQVSTVTASTPAPSVSGSGTATVQAATSTLTATTPAPSISGTGTATISGQVSTLNISTPNPSVSNSGLIQAPVSTITASTPNPSVTGTGTATVQAQETTLTASTPAPSVSGSGTVEVQAPESTLTASTPAPSVEPTGSATIAAETSTLTISTPNPALNNIISEEFTLHISTDAVPPYTLETDAEKPYDISTDAE